MTAKKRRKRRVGTGRPPAHPKMAYGHYLQAQSRKKRKKRRKAAKKRKSTTRKRTAARRPKATKAQLSALIRAFDGESRHGDAKDINALMRAFDGETRHGGEMSPGRRYMTPAQALRKYRRKPSKKSRGVFLSENPIHIPKTNRGRPSKVSFWLLDVYIGNKVKTYIGRSDKSKAQLDAYKKMIRMGASRVALSGPYRKRPHLDSVRK